MSRMKGRQVANKERQIVGFAFVFFTRRWRLCNIFLSLLVLPLTACHTRASSLLAAA